MFHSPGEVKCELLQDSASDIAGQVEIAKLSEVLHPVAGACFVDWTPGQVQPAKYNSAVSTLAIAQDGCVNQNWMGMILFAILNECYTIYISTEHTDIRQLS